MKLSRKWLNEFVDVREVSDHDFAEAMTISGSKVEITEVLNDSLKNVVAGSPAPGTSMWATWCPLPSTSLCCPAA